MADSQPKKFSEAEIFSISCDIRKGVADPEDAKQLIELFCKSADVPSYLYIHFQDVFKRFLYGKGKNKISVERALGLKRKPNRTKADPEINIDMALDTLRLILTGMPEARAIEETEDRFGWGRTKTKVAWKNYKHEALIRESILRYQARAGSDLKGFHPWTEKEEAILNKVFENDPSVICSRKP